MNDFKTIRSCTLILALVLGTAGTGWATVAACGTTPGTAVALSTLGIASTTSGCWADDLSYTSLNLTGGNSSGGGTTPSSANIDLYSAGTAASLNTIGPVSLFVDGFHSITSTGTETGTVAVQATANTGAGVGGLTYTPPTNLALHWAYATLTLTPTLGSIGTGTGDTVTITENFCLNATQATAGGSCKAADQGTITAQYNGSTTVGYTCAFGTTGICVTGTSNEVNFTTLSFLPTTIATTSLVTIDRVGGGGTVTLTNFEDSFGETAVGPEPASWGLMGAALAGLALIGWRKRQQQS
jgi:hypothetical protein